MAREKCNADPSFGFLSTLESPEYGYFGGYLIVSPLGRPREFHCTSPVRPSRAQVILYGPTLPPYLIGEQISGALLRAAKVCPCLILVDTAAMLAARSLARSPMAFVARRTPAVAETFDANVDTGRGNVASASDAQVSPGPIFDAHLENGDYGLILPSGFEAETRAVTELATQLSRHVDLTEPFGRIHEAIREAQRIGGRAVEIQGQAA